MGYRTTIIINNDRADILQTDADIGRKIYSAVLGYCLKHEGSFGPLGEVVEQAHADTVKLIVIGKNGSFTAEELAANPYNPKNVNVELALLKEAADRLGYHLVKSPPKTRS